jgi:hypothetical protein
MNFQTRLRRTWLLALAWLAVCPAPVRAYDWLPATNKIKIT